MSEARDLYSSATLADYGSEGTFLIVVVVIYVIVFLLIRASVSATPSR